MAESSANAATSSMLALPKLLRRKSQEDESERNLVTARKEKEMLPRLFINLR